MFGISTSGWLVPAIAGLAVGFLASPMIARFTHLQPFQAYAATVPHSVPMRLAPHPVPKASGGGGGGLQGFRPTPNVPVHYVPVRRSFDRSYDSWLHTTVNSLPAIG